MIDVEKVIKGLESLHVRLLDAAKRDSIAMLDVIIVSDALALLKAQEPCEDAVSRKDVINVLQSPCDMRYINGNWHPCIGDYIEAITNLSAVAPKAQEQEPRVMGFSEIMAIYNVDPFHVWPYNTPPFLYIQEHPHFRHSSESWAAWREIKDIIEGELFGHTAKSYGVTWRCWNRKPTNELREAVKWE